MKKLFYSFLLLSSATLFAQKNPSTKFAISNDIVGTVEMFSPYNNVIQSMNVYKTPANLPANLKKYSYIAENGLTEIKMKKGQDNIDRLPLSDLNVQFGLPKDTPVLIDGYEFADTNTLVFGNILNNMEVVDRGGKKAVSVTTKK
ncbi:hypothetical protein SAMN05880574_1254 [Chryseobacterium sp. RU37D]|uniref:hypothetical protein n=1 Tax=Chryseobacterium sp. RU37D TaxID=1907397 RepID=UPI000953E24F|nr:hypothetical protein [Chryseobacterium sp. RU37D]SIQ77950.1 hypothetical protein SAMN05880574_1254 [Chryseobacterium sp. RU37D]